MPEMFQKWFKDLTGHQPFPWQEALGNRDICKSGVIRIPTGLGKTDGVLLTWIFNKIILKKKDWPRRLVWCLPMRVLVEQTEFEAKRLVSKFEADNSIDVHVLMGGRAASNEWPLFPEKNAILIGTQDMLLSRGLNRGFSGSRAKWPIEFGLLNQDALWVMDEVQLMDVGLATSAQLQAFREQDGSKNLRPCHTWWMSATLQPEWLRSVDTTECHPTWVQSPCEIPADQRTGGLWDIPKPATTDSIAPDEHKIFAKRILQEHTELTENRFGRITLVVCNTVERACHTFDALRAGGRTEGLELVHSRFRPFEREEWRKKFLNKETCTQGVDRIIVATQVVEAGVDISAGCLITELAPWPSLVQRFGRCARFGGTGHVLVIDRGRDEKQALPYGTPELDCAWETIQQLRDVGIKSLEVHERSLEKETRQRLFPYTPAHLLLRKEFDELFDTTPDLTGADLDISRFIRSGDERDLQVFWQEVPIDNKGKPRNIPPEDYKPFRAELCAIPFLKAREWLCEKGKSKLKGKMRAWVWDWLDGEWKVATSESLFPGRVVCVATDSGGYTAQRGFSPEATTRVTPLTPDTQNDKLDQDDDGEESEQRSFTNWKTLICHTDEVVKEVKALCTLMGLPGPLADALELAAWFHDWGKAHPAFQNMLFRKQEGTETLRTFIMAKSKDTKPRSKPRYFAGANGSDERRGFRHELASALGLFAILETYAPQHPALLGPWNEVLSKLGKSPMPSETPNWKPPIIQKLLDCSADFFDLVAYLVASHHGKVRVGLHAAPKDQEYRDKDGRGLPIRGIREGDDLPSVSLVPGEPALPEVHLTLLPASLGLSERTGISWRERCLELMDRYGPTGLAFLESILRAGDVRASRLKTNDPALETEFNR